MNHHSLPFIIFFLIITSFIIIIFFLVNNYLFYVVLVSHLQDEVFLIFMLPFKFLKVEIKDKLIHK